MTSRLPKPATMTTRATRSKTTTPADPTPAMATRTTRTAAMKPRGPPAPVKKTTTRKVTQTATKDSEGPSNPDSTTTKKAPAAASKPTNGSQPVVIPPDHDVEPVKAFLRIRPQINDDTPSDKPYLEQLSDTSVRMLDLAGPATNPSRYRLSTVPQTSTYSFSHVFPPATLQSLFFTKTTLPLVQDLLQGQNALLFTYGVTNSGKTYTVQGGSDPSSAGILPRTLDVIFNSVGRLQSDSKYGPVRLQGVEAADPTSDANKIQSLAKLRQDPMLAQVLEDELEGEDLDTAVDSTVLRVDKNYTYSIWLSYAEVYNEKVYDLLADTSPVKGGTKAGPSTLLLARKALTIKPSPPSDWEGSQNAGKYVAGLRQIRVHSAAQAKEMLKLGQLHRKVFGTLANSQSSRSHALVTVKLLRCHRGDYHDPSNVQTSRLTLVDLAGSERTKNTQTSGDRLREAGSINKSLMVLGQCMEVMRANQKRLAQSLANAGRVDTRDVKKTLAVVPFRHSKLTEILMDYFVGDGRVVMIVNVNPYDTGFDENSHVMKFAALAREVTTTRKPAPPAKKGSSAVTSRPSEQYRRKVTISMGKPGRQSEALLEVLEEDEEAGDPEDTDDDLELNKAFVSALFDEIDDLRMQLFEAEMRCAITEAETREEVMEDMEQRMRNMEKMYLKRITDEVEMNERKMDAKIDMLHQTGLLDSEETSEEEEYSEKENHAPDYMSQDDEFEYEETASSPLDGKSALDRSQHFPPSAKRTQWKAAKDDMDVTMDMSLDGPPEMDVDEEEEDLPPPRLVQQRQLSRAPSPIFEADVEQTRASSSQARAKGKAKAQPAPAKAARNTRSSKVQDQESEDSMSSDSPEAQPTRMVAAATKKKRVLNTKRK
ncbi:P-loop containing nucleoside triphosphate hydrolase protein [Thelephora terrestris]|uniref:Kinesin-like protein n=1 Tax=Thelephora terrestris TaxID=56493 RepID=A0A9P6HFU9_9AGAM|nr:P-loop containing nucleoside triphosphate hydrolase protein [Thelephora terrestris]